VTRTEGETYFNNFQQTGYEEMKAWTPSYYQEIKEADANLRFAGKTVGLMAQALEDWCLNQFIDTMDEEAVSRMETFYYMEQNASRPMRDRKRLLKAAQLGSGKIDRDRIGRMVEQYIGIYPTFDFHTAKFEINVEAADDFTLIPNDLMNFLRKNMPAHIDFVLIFGNIIEIIWHDQEQIEFPYMKVAFSITMYDGHFMLDGSWPLDGSVILNQRRGYKVGSGVNSRFQIEESPEEVGQTFIEYHSHNYTLLNGAKLLNGSFYLDTYYRKEIVE